MGKWYGWGGLEPPTSGATNLKPSVIARFRSGSSQRLGACDTLTKKRATAVDLLAANSIKWWTPHDLRRTITKVLDAAGIPGGASVVLAHEVRRTDKLDVENDDSREQRVARITRLAYGGAQHLHLKRKAMTIWTDAVLDKYHGLQLDWKPEDAN